MFFLIAIILHDMKKELKKDSLNEYEKQKNLDLFYL